MWILQGHSHSFHFLISCIKPSRDFLFSNLRSWSFPNFWVKIQNLLSTTINTVNSIYKKLLVCLSYSKECPSVCIFHYSIFHYFWLKAINNFLNFNNKWVYTFMVVRELFLSNISSKFEVLWLWIILWHR